MRNEKEYELKYAGMRILKSIQEYLKVEDSGEAALYPIKVPSELLYHVTKLQSPEESDRVVHTIFRLGLKVWADKLFEEVFGSAKELEGFIEIMRKEGRKRESTSAVPVSRISRSPKSIRKEPDSVLIRRLTWFKKASAFSSWRMTPMISFLFKKCSPPWLSCATSSNGLEPMMTH